mmetsp:Transcript_35784/g.93631  ORF Transcript_35784/g.93631 Transcript_35784/m.93631 type:complete len:229 (-) Transcript_35784:23-709(-)
MIHGRVRDHRNVPFRRFGDGEFRANPAVDQAVVRGRFDRHIERATAEPQRSGAAAIKRRRSREAPRSRLDGTVPKSTARRCERPPLAHRPHGGMSHHGHHPPEHHPPDASPSPRRRPRDCRHPAQHRGSDAYAPSASISAAPKRPVVGCIITSRWRALICGSHSTVSGSPLPALVRRKAAGDVTMVSVTMARMGVDDAESNHRPSRRTPQTVCTLSARVHYHPRHRCA